MKRCWPATCFSRRWASPAATIEKEYTLGSVGQLRTRFQAFVESLEIKKLGHKEV